ncbi:predicted periplasmic lipoprotein [Hahella chejuensis KCTC 2396]|uniref:Predicted periplasmic lipoprotein n=1 Tax=Hahella chejuensis (strain KCTC 2396) TaxID=349521 RepID=Q2SPS8_HAHCH|nr:YfiM family lipoprotein [Hahella chejuensis]ABC27346.1 predicted periplasmic lipoprotein [Hahella chejuensis KCTC 2396]
MGDCIKPALVLTLALFLSSCAALREDPSDWLGKDKIAHFTASAAIAAAAADQLDSGSRSDCGSAALSVGVAMTFGAGKEYYDENYAGKYWSYKDMAVNLLGALTGALAASRCL